MSGFSVTDLANLIEETASRAYAEGVVHGLFIARDVEVAMEKLGLPPVEKLKDAVAYFEEHTE